MFVFINRFKVNGSRAEFEEVLGRITAHMTSQPGFRHSSLYRSSREPDVYVEMAEWDDAQSHGAAAQGSGFQTNIGALLKLASAEPAPFELLATHAARPTR